MAGSLARSNLPVQFESVFQVTDFNFPKKFAVSLKMVLVTCTCSLPFLQLVPNCAPPLSFTSFLLHLQTLSQLLCESRGENKALKKDLAELRQLYHDSQEDIQFLRDALAKQKKRSNSVKTGDDGMDPRQDLISQLEKSQEKA